MSEHPEHEVRVEYKLEQHEVVPALRRVLLHNRRLQQILAVSLLLVGLGSAMVAESIDRPFAAFAAFTGLFYVILLGAALTFGPRLAWQRNALLRGDQLAIFSAAGVYARSTVTESRSKWSVYAGMKETDTCYLLRLATRPAYVFVPKRAFASPADEAIFRELVALHVHPGENAAIAR